MASKDLMYPSTLIVQRNDGGDTDDYYVGYSSEDEIDGSATQRIAIYKLERVVDVVKQGVTLKSAKNVKP